MEKEEDFYQLIKKFNEIYKLPINEKPTLISAERLENFKSVLLEEVNEIDDILEKYKKENLTEEEKLEILTHLSDWLGDLVVYITSESTKHGIDLDETLKIIMQSNFSKLGQDGKPIYDERGKVMKGPNYWRPEEKIKQMLKKSLK